MNLWLGPALVAFGVVLIVGTTFERFAWRRLPRMLRLDLEPESYHGEGRDTRMRLILSGFMSLLIGLSITFRWP